MQCRGVAVWRQFADGNRFADRQYGQQRFLVVLGGVGFVAALHVHLAIAGERDRGAACRELAVSALRGRVEANRNGGADVPFEDATSYVQGRG